LVFIAMAVWAFVGAALFYRPLSASGDSGNPEAGLLAAIAGVGALSGLITAVSGFMLAWAKLTEVRRHRSSPSPSPSQDI
jgi:hypothetical protein